MTGTPADANRAIIERNRRALHERISRAQEAAERARDEEREARLALDEYEKRHRPSYPNADLLEGLARAAEDIRAEHVPHSHLGRRFGAHVVVHGAQRWISVETDAPYAAAHNGRLWKFSRDEEIAIRKAVWEQGLDVEETWHHERGFSLVVDVR